MTEPRTEAGRILLRDIDKSWPGWSAIRDAVLAIEAEAAVEPRDPGVDGSPIRGMWAAAGPRDLHIPDDVATVPDRLYGWHRAMKAAAGPRASLHDRIFGPNPEAVMAARAEAAAGPRDEGLRELVDQLLARPEDEIAGEAYEIADRLRAALAKASE